MAIDPKTGRTAYAEQQRQAKMAARRRASGVTAPVDAPVSPVSNNTYPDSDIPLEQTVQRGDQTYTASGINVTPRQAPTVPTAERAVITRGGAETEVKDPYQSQLDMVMDLKRQNLGANQVATILNDEGFSQVEIDKLMKDAGAKQEQALEDIAIKKAMGRTLTEDDYRAEYRANRQPAASQAPLTRDPYMPEEFASLTAEQISTLPPGEQARYAQAAEYAQAQRDQEFQRQQGGQIDDVFGSRIEGAEQDQAAAEDRIKAENQQLVDEFRSLREQMQAGTVQDVQEAGAEGLDRIQAMASRRGFGRSSATAKQLQKATSNTQRRIQDIELATGAAVSQYQVQLLDRLDRKMAKYEARVDKFKDAKDVAKLQQAQQELEMAQKVFEADPRSPENMMELASTLSQMRISKDKAMQAAVQDKFEKGMEYGYVPQFSQDEVGTLASNFGIPQDQFPQLMADMQMKAEYEKMGENIEYETDNEGNVTALMFNTKTGNFDKKELGQIGKGVESRFQISNNPVTGETMIFDPSSGKIIGKYDAFGGFEGTGSTTSGGGNYPSVGGASDEAIGDVFGGIGKVGGWCGVFASKISDAGPVGDYWSSKKTKITHNSNPTQGDKLLVPLGVSSDGKGYGHVATVLDFNPETGEVKVIESNKDGRQNTDRGGNTKGIITVGTYNINTLNSKYSGNWGFMKGNLRSKYANGINGLPKPQEATESTGGSIEDGTRYESILKGAIADGMPAKEAISYARDVLKEERAEQRQIEKEARTPTQAQSEAATFAERLKQSEDVFSALEGEGYNFADNKYIQERATPSSLFGVSLGGAGKSGEIKRQEQAERNFVNAVLRRESGAAIAPSEFESAQLQYFPQPGDTPEVLQQKKLNRQTALQGLENASGQAAFSTSLEDKPGIEAPQSSNAIQVALDQGESPQSIINYIKNKPKYAETITSLTGAGFSAKEIVEYLQNQ